MERESNPGSIDDGIGPSLQPGDVCVLAERSGLNDLDRVIRLSTSSPFSTWSNDPAIRELAGSLEPIERSSRLRNSRIRSSFVDQKPSIAGREKNARLRLGLQVA